MSASILNRLASQITTPAFMPEDLDASLAAQADQGPDPDNPPNAPAANSTPDAQPSVDTVAQAPPPQISSLLGIESDQAQENANDDVQQAQQAPAPDSGPSPAVAGPMPAPQGPQMQAAQMQGPMPLGPPELDSNPYLAAMGTPAPSGAPAPPAGMGGPSPPAPAPLGPPGEPLSPPPSGIAAGNPAPPSTGSGMPATNALAAKPPTTEEKQVQTLLDDFLKANKAKQELILERAAKAPPPVARQILATIAGMFAGPKIGQLIADPSSPQFNRKYAAADQQVSATMQALQAYDAAQNVQSNIQTRADRVANSQQATANTQQAKIADNLTKLESRGAQEIPMNADGTEPPLPKDTYKIATPPGASPNSIWVQKTPEGLAADAAAKKLQGIPMGPTPAAIKKAWPEAPNQLPLADITKWMQELAKPQGGTPNETLLGIRAQGKTTGNAVIDQMTPAEADAARVKPPKPDNGMAATAALDREVTNFGRPYQKMYDGVDSQMDKVLDAEKMIAGGAMGQALGVPKVLTALVSGQGSGVRITQPELNAIYEARGIVGGIQGWFDKISGQGKLNATQQAQLQSILGDVRARIQQKQQIVNDTLDKIRGAPDRSTIISADKEARQRLKDLEVSTGGNTASTTPKSMEQTSPSTGAKRHSLDGGKTWLPGPLQSQQ